MSSHYLRDHLFWHPWKTNINPTFSWGHNVLNNFSKILVPKSQHQKMTRTIPSRIEQRQKTDIKPRNFRGLISPGGSLGFLPYLSDAIHWLWVEEAPLIERCDGHAHSQRPGAWPAHSSNSAAPTAGLASPCYGQGCSYLPGFDLKAAHKAKIAQSPNCS